MAPVLLVEFLFTEGSSTFNWDHFLKLKQQPQMLAYAKANLAYVDEGFSRMTFILSPKKALKIGSLPGSFRQNAMEWETITRTNNPILPKAYARSPAFDWIVVELVKPMFHRAKNNEAEDNRRISKFNDEFTQLSGGLTLEVLLKLAKGEVNEIPEMTNESKQLVQNTKEYIKTSGHGDMYKPANWGKGPDGRLVFLDPGLAKRL